VGGRMDRPGGNSGKKGLFITSCPHEFLEVIPGLLHLSLREYRVT
jgi:hypothetical protein